MKTFSQIDPRWKSERLGDSEMTIGGYGCFLTAIAILGQKLNPSELNKSAIRNNGFAPHGLLYSARVAELVGINAVFSNKKLNFKKPLKNIACIAITDHYRKTRGVFQHFFVYLPDGRIIDPLDLNPKPRENNYNIIAYRHFTNVELDISEKENVISREKIDDEIERNSRIWHLAEQSKNVANRIQEEVHESNEQYRTMLEII